MLKVLLSFILLFQFSASAEVISVASFEFPPYVSKHKGFFNDVIKEYNQNQKINGGNFTIKLVIYPYKRAIVSFTSGKEQALITSNKKLAEEFGENYIMLPLVNLAIGVYTVSNRLIKLMDKSQKYTIGVIRGGSLAKKALNESAKANITIYELDSHQGLFRMLEFGRIDGIFLSDELYLKLADKKYNFQKLKFDLPILQIGLALRVITSRPFVDNFDEFMTFFIHTEKYKELIKKHFGIDSNALRLTSFDVVDASTLHQR